MKVIGRAAGARGSFRLRFGQGGLASDLYGDLVKAQERFRRVSKLYEDTASAAMLKRASFHLVGFFSAEYDMHAWRTTLGKSCNASGRRDLDDTGFRLWIDPTTDFARTRILTTSPKLLCRGSGVLDRLKHSNAFNNQTVV